MSNIVVVHGPHMTLRVDREFLKNLGFTPGQKLTAKQFTKVVAALTAAKKAAGEAA